MEEPSENSGHLSGKFDDFEFTPPEPVWDRVRSDLAQGPGAGFLAEPMQGLAHAPRAAVWRKIARQINPAYARRRAMAWWSAAAGIALLFGWGMATNFGGLISGAETGNPSGLAGATVLPADSTNNSLPGRNLADELPADPRLESAGPTPALANMDPVDLAGPYPDPTAGGNISPRNPLAATPPYSPGTIPPSEGPNEAPSVGERIQKLSERPLPNTLTTRSVALLTATELPVRPEESQQAPAVVLTEIPRFPGEEPGGEAGEDRYGVLLSSGVQGGAISPFTVGRQEAFVNSDESVSPLLQSADPALPRSGEKYAPPLVIGGKFRLNLSRRWASDLGLNYTLLRSSETRDLGSSILETNLARHYLGPSAEIVYNLRPERKVNFYLSGGMKIDFGLVGNVQQKRTEDAVVTDEDSYSIPAGQNLFALMGAGVDVKLAPQWSLFGQANGSYVLRQRIPIFWSGRTVWPSAQVGLRFDLP